MADDTFARLRVEIQACARCVADLPLGPRPVVRGLPSARLLIISQAPGTRVHETGLSFNDRSGDRLRDWLGIGRDLFYDETRVAIMGMGFCYPGRDPRGGDRPPMTACAPLWHPLLRPHFAAVRLTPLVGSYAIHHYLPQTRRGTLGQTLRRWHHFVPEYFVLPHPSSPPTHFPPPNPPFHADFLP